MKKITTSFLFLLCLTTTLYSQEMSEKEKMKVINKVRKEIQAEEKAKQKAIADAEQAKIARAKMEEIKGKKLIEETRREMNESLEEKVFRSENTTEARAAAEAFKLGKERMSFLEIEEEELSKFEKELGIETSEEQKLLNKKYDEIHAKFSSVSSESELLAYENEKLREQLVRLEKMETKIRIGKK